MHRLTTRLLRRPKPHVLFREQRPNLSNFAHQYNPRDNYPQGSGLGFSNRAMSTYDSTFLDLAHPECNVPPHIAEKILSEEPKLYQISPHPLYTIKKRIEEFFPDFAAKDSLAPLVSTEANFDSLLIPKDHVSRSKSDTYYATADVCLRTHTSAHQVELLRQGNTQFLCTGDVYRRDDIDRSHYPVFH